MKNPELTESEQLAILAELAGPLVHESNNFLNNLFLHMALFQDHLPGQLRADCENVRKEGKKLVSLLRQWQGSRRVCSDRTGKIELNQLIKETLEQIHADDGTPRFTLALAPEPLWVQGPAGKFKRFCHLWLRNALEIRKDRDGNMEGVLAIQTERQQDRIRLRIADVGSAIPPDNWHELEDEGSPAESLTMAACKSLARHLHGNIRMERAGHNQTSLVVEFS